MRRPVPRVTALGSFVVHNATSYDTDDLVALIERIEAVAAREDQGRPRLSMSVRGAAEKETGRDPGLTGEPAPLHFIHAKGPVEPLVTDHETWMQWVVIRNVKEMLQPTRLRLLPPHRLHVNPLRSLLSAAGEQRVPATMLHELARIVQDLYEAWGCYMLEGDDTMILRGRPGNVDLRGLGVRVGNRRHTRDTPGP